MAGIGRVGLTALLIQRQLLRKKLSAGIALYASLKAGKP